MKHQLSKEFLQHLSNRLKKLGLSKSEIVEVKVISGGLHTLWDKRLQKIKVEYLFIAEALSTSAKLPSIFKIVFLTHKLKAY